MLISWTWSLPSRVNLIQRRLSYQRRLQNLFRRVETSYGGQQYALMRLRGATLTMLTFLVTGSSLASTPMKSRRMLSSTSGGTAMRKYTISSPVQLFIYLFGLHFLLRENYIRPVVFPSNRPFVVRLYGSSLHFSHSRNHITSPFRRRLLTDAVE